MLTLPFRVATPDEGHVATPALRPVYDEPVTVREGDERTAKPLTFRAYAVLHDAIVRCELAPGSWITASEIAERFGLGHTPTLRALSRLESAGFARAVKRKGWQISPLTPQTVDDILEALRLTGPDLMALACRNATDEQIEKLRTMSRAWSPPGSDPHVEPDLGLTPFTYLAEICGNPVMTRMAVPMTAHAHRVYNLGIRHGIFADSVAMRWREQALDALAVRDAARSRSAMAEAVRVAQTQLRRMLRGMPTDASVSAVLEASATGGVRAAG